LARINGIALVPAVLGITLFAQTALALYFAG